MNVTTDSSSSRIGMMNSVTIADLSYSIGFSIAILLVLVIVSYASYKCYNHRTSSTFNNFNFSSHGRTRTRTSSSRALIAATKGVDEEILVKYPKFLYCETRPQKGDSILASGCSICLVDYKDDHMVRILPICGHIFHVKCIDSWLKLHPSCPICRSKPLPIPVSEAVMQ